MQVKYFGILGLLLASSHVAANQVWEKPVAPGLVYRMEITQDPPRVIHVLKLISSNPVTSVIPELGNRTVYDSKSDGRSTVSQMVKDTNALAAINADFFPFTGDPLGLMVREGQFISLPHPKRAAFAWGPNTSVFGFSRFSGSVTTEKGTSVDIDGLDEECQENRVTLNGPEAGISKSKNPCLTVVLKLDGGRLMPTTQIGASVIASSNDGANMPLKAGQFTLVAQGNKMSQLSGLKPGDRLTIKLTTTGFDWEKLDNAVGGGPLLLRNGEIAVDAENEGFGKDFVDTRHPRTAVGRTGDGDLVFVTVDGRQKVSVGATLGELAEIMQGLGCRDALNLDGGGSTCMNIFGLDMSRPSDKTGERPVANGIAFYGPKPLTADQKLKIVVPASMNVNGTAQAKVVDKDGREVPNIEVFWSLQGAAWVDQGGQVSGLQEGTATLQAYVRGTILSTNITVKQP